MFENIILSFKSQNLIQRILSIGKLFAPVVIIFLSSFVSLNKNSFKDSEIVAFRPDSAVFSIALGILSLLLGISWLYSNSLDLLDNRLLHFHNILYISLIIVLGSWTIIYNNNYKIYSIWIILAALLLTITIMIFTSNFSKMMLAPLMVWLLAALMMLTHEIQTSEIYSKVVMKG